MEDEIDLREAKKALADMKRRGLKPVAYARVRQRLGLKSLPRRYRVRAGG